MNIAIHSIRRIIGVALGMIRTVWEIIWMLTGGMLLSLLAMGGALLAACSLPASGCYLWFKRRKNRSKLDP